VYTGFIEQYFKQQEKFLWGLN